MKGKKMTVALLKRIGWVMLLVGILSLSSVAQDTPPPSLEPKPEKTGAWEFDAQMLREYNARKRAFYLKLSLAKASEKANASENSISQDGYTKGGWMKAEVYLKLDPAAQGMYVRGMLEGIYYVLENDKMSMRFGPCLDEMKLPQAVAIVEKWVKDHPERWHKTLASQAFDALQVACVKQEVEKN
jgi:hypothetical protein